MGVPISSVAAKMCILKDQVCSIMSIYSIMYVTLPAAPLLQSLLSAIEIVRIMYIVTANNQGVSIAVFSRFESCQDSQDLSHADSVLSTDPAL